MFDFISPEVRDNLLTGATSAISKLALALLFLIVGLRVISFLTKMVGRIIGKYDFDQSLSKFLLSLLSVVLKILLIISVLGVLGVETTSFIALIGAAGIAIGAALSGTLQNFAAGVMVLIFKPFKVGDVITAQEVTGQVEEIQIFNTVLATPANDTVIVPNSQITSGIVTNHSAKKYRRFDFTVGIGYNDDIDKAKEVLRKVVEGEGLVENPAKAVIEVVELGDSSVNMAVFCYVKPENYIPLTATLPEKVKKALDAAKISIPFPQRDVHMHNT